MLNKKRSFLKLIDISFSPCTLLAALWFKKIRDLVKLMPITEKILLKVGVFPIKDHYYEPRFNFEHLKKPFGKDRSLPGLNLNVKEQLAFLGKFHYNRELIKFPVNKKGNGKAFYYNNGWFGPGDAEYLYNLVRLLKPRRIIEAGGGFSTLMVVNAVNRNIKEDPKYKCDHICIEPYENDWLDKVRGVKIIRKQVEKVGIPLFTRLKENDILFIDSSHIIKPQGDVLFLFQEILPQLNSGVFVHIHDIFTPRDYPKEWITEERRFWNEQYLLESFLAFNNKFKVIGATNYLAHNHYSKFSAKCPIFKRQRKRECGSFWIMKE